MLLHQYQYLTITQIVKLLGKESTVNNIRAKLKRLVDDKLVETQGLHDGKHIAGRLAYVYSLTRKGVRSLSDSGETAKKSGVAVEHTLAINDVAILAQGIGRVVPQVVLFETRLESSLKKYPVILKQTEQEAQCLVPDVWTHLTLFPPFTKLTYANLGIFFEIDRGTEDVYTIKEKIQKYRALLLTDGLYEHSFGIAALIIAFVVTAGKQRLRQLLLWMNQELMRTPGSAPFFSVTACDPATISPASFFCDPIWYHPLDPSPHPLIERKI